MNNNLTHWQIGVTVWLLVLIAVYFGLSTAFGWLHVVPFFLLYFEIAVWRDVRKVNLRMARTLSWVLLVMYLLTAIGLLGWFQLNAAFGETYINWGTVLPTILPILILIIGKIIVIRKINILSSPK